jgi:hypothetical protein
LQILQARKLGARTSNPADKTTFIAQQNELVLLPSMAIRSVMLRAFNEIHIPITMELQVADQPEYVTEASDRHCIIIIPVSDVTGVGTVQPEFELSTRFCKQSIAVQLLMVTKS